jgi:uncharacterized membrane protein YozB (DUF420 family)
MSYSDLPAVNASLNALSAVFLLFGFRFIRRKNVPAHRLCMLAAVVTSTLFLVCYVTYHAKVGGTVFKDPPWFRWIYIPLLISHVVLAMAIVPMVIITLSRALRQRFDKHKRIARWTWPLWMYVSVTGVLIYFLLYHIFPQH